MGRRNVPGLASLGKYFLSAALLLSSVPANAGYAHYVLDANSGKVLESDHADTLNHPASLTKMMTLYVAFEALHTGRLRWDEEITVSTRAARTTPLKLGLRAGSKIKVRDAVLGSIVLSANDAAQALCDHLAGRGDCGSMLTRKARQLGMTRTVFHNGSGLPDPRQVTTARDMATLGLALLRNYPNEYKLFSTRSFAFRGRTINGHNNLMYRYRGMDGIKTGYTNASGFNIVSAVNENGRRVIGVVMGGRTAASRDAKMAQLLNEAVPEASSRRYAGGKTNQKGVELASLEDDTSTPVPAERIETIEKPKKQKLKPIAAAPVAPVRDETAMAAPAAPAVKQADTSADNTSADDNGGMWQIQIAAAGSEDEARAILEKARGSAGSALNGAMNYTAPASGGMVRARFIGFNNRSTAENACEALKSKSYKCFVVADKG